MTRLSQETRQPKHDIQGYHLLKSSAEGVVDIRVLVPAQWFTVHNVVPALPKASVRPRTSLNAPEPMSGVGRI